MKSQSSEIEIGMSVIGKLYLNVIAVGCNEVAVPEVAFDVSNIKKIEESDNGTIIWYAETSGQFDTFVDVHQYTVKEKKEDIEKAIADARM